MNKFIGIGNVTRDVEVNTTPSGISVAKFAIAINRRFANADGTRECDYLNIVAWRQLGENCGKFLKKGSKVGIVGNVQMRSYDAQDGSKRYVTEIVAEEVQFLTPKNNDQQDASDDATQGIGSPEQMKITDDALPF